MDNTKEPSGTAEPGDVEDLEDLDVVLARVRSLSRQFSRAADQVVIGFTSRAAATADAKRLERFTPTGDDIADRATLALLEAQIRRDLRTAKAEAKRNGQRTTLGAAGLIIGG